MTGRDGGKVKDLVDVAIVVPETETFKIQELHLPIYHCLCLMVEEAVFGVQLETNREYCSSVEK